MGNYAFIAERQSDDGCTVAHIICFHVSTPRNVPVRT